MELLSILGLGCFFPVTLLFLLFSLFILSLACPPVSSSVSVFSRCDIPVPLLLPMHWHTCDSATHQAPVNPGSGLSQIFQLWCWCWCCSQTGGRVEDFPCVCLNSTVSAWTWAPCSLFSWELSSTSLVRWLLFIRLTADSSAHAARIAPSSALSALF